MPRSREGRIYVDKEGRVYARIRLTDAEGKERDIKLRAENRTEAKELLRRKLYEIDTGSSAALSARNVTLGQVLDKYLEAEWKPAVIVNGRKVAGRKSLGMRWVWDELRRVFGARRLQQITRSDLERFRRLRLEAPVERTGKARSVRTVNIEMARLRAVFYFAHRQGWLGRSPAPLFAGLISAADENRRSRLLTREEEERLLAACTGRREHLRPLVIAAIDTSLRKSTLLALRWSDVDFKARVLRVRKTTTKTEKAVVIGLTSRLETTLQALWVLSDEEPSSLVFGISGEFKRAWMSACKIAGIEGLTFHDLRGRAATDLLLAGVPEEIARKITSHTSVKVLHEHYTRVDDEIARRVSEMVDRMREAGKETIVESKKIN